MAIWGTAFATPLHSECCCLVRVFSHTAVSQTLCIFFSKFTRETSNCLHFSYSQGEKCPSSVYFYGCYICTADWLQALSFVALCPQVGNYKRAVKRFDDGHRLCNDLMGCLQERAKIEKAYGDQLTAWSKRWRQLIEKGQLLLKCQQDKKAQMYCYLSPCVLLFRCVFHYFTE